MSADILRRAAALMRERASAATPGPWVVPLPGDEYMGPADVVGDGEPGGRYIICERAGMDAAHIASWHPGVALAVADWLDEVAWRSERVPKQYRAAKLALAVARAYMGESSDERE